MLTISQDSHTHVTGFLPSPELTLTERMALIPAATVWASHCLGSAKFQSLDPSDSHQVVALSRIRGATPWLRDLEISFVTSPPH